jgi:rhodanese-related sulfurtransferase
MRRVQLFLVIFLLLGSQAYSEAPIQKQLALAKCMSAQDVFEGHGLRAEKAYEIWKSNPEGVTILDVRTPEEYVYVGHAPEAINVPWALWSGKWDPQKNQVALTENEDFVSEVKNRFKSNQMILVMCCSGPRASKAVDRLIGQGFKNVYNVTDGFEGEMSDDEESYLKGKKVKNGWKNCGAPWNYEVKGALMSLNTK